MYTQLGVADLQIDCLRTVLQQRINENTAFVAAWQEAMGLTDLPPVNVTFPCDPFPSAMADGWDGVAAGNANFPALFCWRSACEWNGETWDADTNEALCEFKYILPANPAAEVTWPLLQAMVREFRRILQEAGRRSGIYPDQDTSPTSKYETDFARFKASGFNSWAYKLNARYRYEGPGGQALYPVAHGSFAFRHTTRENTDILPYFASLRAAYGIVGRDQDGSASPSINPLLIAQEPPGS